MESELVTGEAETAERALAERSTDIRLIAQIIRANGTPKPSEVAKLQPLIDKVRDTVLNSENPKVRTMRSVKNLVLIAKHLDDQRMRQEESEHKREMDKAKLYLEAERNDLAKVGLALRAAQARVPVDIFGHRVGAPAESTDEVETEFDKMLAACETPEEIEAIERVLNRMKD